MDRKRNSGLVYSTNDAPKSAIFRYDIKWDDVIEEVSQTTELSYYEKNAADDFVRRVNKLTAGLVSLDCVCDILDDLVKKTGPIGVEASRNSIEFPSQRSQIS